MKTVFPLLILLFSTVLPLGAAPARGTYLETEGEGKALVEDLLARMPPEDTEILGLLKIRSADEPQLEIPVKMTVRIGTNTWYDVYETQPVTGHPGEVLVIEHRGRQPNRYLHAQFAEKPKQQDLKPVQGDAIYRSLSGSDFFLADLGLEFLHWPNQKIVQKEMRKGRSCRVVESINPNPTQAGYSRVLSWVDLETGNIILAEGFDVKNNKLKEFSVRKVSRQEGKAQLKEIEIRNDRTDSRTRLEFNLEINGQ